jgi:hypothetical protein
MITLALHLLRLLPFLCAGQRQLALENLALRQQLAVYKRTVPRPRLHTMDRLVWVGLARVWTGWRLQPGSGLFHGSTGLGCSRASSDEVLAKDRQIQ